MNLSNLKKTRLALKDVWACAVSLWALSVLAASAATYYVSPQGDDGNPGTREAPWRSAGHAGETAGAGDTVLFLPGDYFDTLEPAHSGKPDSPIVFKAVERRQARLIGDAEGTQAEGHGGRIRLHNVSHIVIRGFEVVDTAVNRSTGGWLWAGQSSHLVIRDCGFKGGYRWALFWIEDSEHVRVLDSDFERDRHSGDMWRIREVDNFLAEGNSLRKSLHTQAGVGFGENIVIRGNVFHAGTARNFSTNSNRRILVENNIFTNAYNGSWSAGSMNQFTGDLHIIRFNRTFRNFGIPLIITASSSRNTFHTRIYNNVFYDNHGAGMLVNGRHANLRDLILRNNIFYRNDPYGSRTQFSTTGGDRRSLELISNDFYSGDENIDTLLLHGTRPLSLEEAEGRGLRGDLQRELEGVARGNLQVDPLFEAPETWNFALQSNSPLRGRGSALTETRSAGSGTRILVKDVYPFYDGFDFTNEPGDLIAVGNPPKQARIREINYERNELRVDREMQWRSSDPVSLSWSGEGPSLGVYEYGANARPTVQVITDQVVLKEGDTAEFRAVARGLEHPLEYAWHLGDGNVTEGESIRHQYKRPGDYGVRVRVTDAFGESRTGVGYVLVEGEKDPDVLIHTTFDADDEEWWKHWQFYRGRRGTGYASYERILDDETGKGYHRIAALDNNGPLPAFLHPRNWNIDRYPRVSIRYRIRPGTPIAIFVRPFPSAEYYREDLDFRQDQRRYYFAGTRTEPRGNRVLLDDNQWHEITFDVRDIRKEYPDVQFLQSLEIGDLEIDGGTAVPSNGEFWLDEVYIGK